jgi:methylase of polypeptide subunit release factors
MGKAFGNKTAESERPIIRKGDNYSTHYSLTELLFEKVKFDFTKTVLEPAAGEGAMVKVLKKRFKEVVSCDPVYGCVCFNKKKKTEKHDMWNYSFLNSTMWNYGKPFPYIITNPPYSLADRFVLRAKELNPEKICFLLRTNYLSGQKRLKKGVFDGLKNVFVFNRMPDLRAPIRPDGKFITAMNVYAWFVWERGYQGEPMLDWIDCSKYTLREKDLDHAYLQQLVDLGIRKML